MKYNAGPIYFSSHSSKGWGGVSWTEVRSLDLPLASVADRIPRPDSLWGSAVTWILTGIFLQ